ncbi:hypothetical protein GH733_001649 [Mirounga leonina]|nr:hypothetical protein GH733_004755 [Mirounga leonina]KAF3830781.1 hypothetical protein GH733_001649 [Mirounga leonina]
MQIGECNNAGPFASGKIWTFKSASPGAIISLETDLKQPVIYRTHQISVLFLAFTYRVPIATERGCQIFHEYVFDERFWARLQVEQCRFLHFKLSDVLK